MGWAVRKTNAGFIGAEALANAGPLAKRCVGFTLDDPAVVLVGRETISRDGQPVGYLTSGGYGYTIGKPVGYGYVRNSSGVSDAFLTSGSYALVVASETDPAEITLDALFDPTNSRVKA